MDLQHRPVPSPGEVERELASFWRRTAEGEPSVIRACSMNLVVVCSEAPDDLQRATEAVARISETIPGRALVLATARKNDASGLQVHVAAHCHRSACGAQICSEQVTLVPTEATLERIPATVLQLLVEDMPVYLWWRRPELRGEEPLRQLMELADYLVVDSSASDAPDFTMFNLNLSSMRGLVRKQQVLDATWARSEPWREAVASFFDGAGPRPALEGITRLEIVSGGPVSGPGVTPAGAYLAGWLISRLDWREDVPPTRWLRPDGKSLEIRFRHDATLPRGELGHVRIESRRKFDTWTFTVERTAAGSLKLSAIPEACSPPHSIRPPELDPAAEVCGLLQRTGRDRVFGSALQIAERIFRSC